MNTHKYILYGAGEQGAVTAEIVEITGNEFLFFLDQDSSIKKKIGYDVFQQDDRNLKIENCFYLI